MENAIFDRVAAMAWRARRRGTGMRLSHSEVLALHEIQGDGDWWQSFNPAIPRDLARKIRDDA